MTRSVSALTLLAASLLAPAPARAQTPAQAQPVTTLKLTTRAVVVDVVVTDSKGHPVHNLKPSDFTLLESGKPQSLAHVDEHTPKAPGPPPILPKFPPGTFTNFSIAPPDSAINVLLLDALNTPLEDQVFVRQEMMKYLKTPRPGLRMAIFGLGSQLRLLQGFTTDPELLRAVVSGKKIELQASPILNDQLTNRDLNPAAPVDPNANSITDMGNVPSNDIMAANVKQFQAERTSFQLALRTRVTLEALNILGRYLGSLPGRKNLIWFADSFPINILPDGSLRFPFAAAESMAGEFRDTANLLARAQVAVYPIDARGLVGSPLLDATSTDADAGFASAPGAAGAIDKHSESILEQNTAGQSTMMLMAENTGGKAFVNNNDLKKAVEQAVEAGSNYYTLTYSPTDPDWHGDFRKLEVKLAASGYKLAYRRGYFADDPDSTHPATSAEAAGKPVTAYDPMHVAMLLGGPDPTEIIFSATVHPTTGDVEPDLAPGNKGDPKSGPFKRYTISFKVDGKAVAGPAAANGDHHLDIGFATYVYSEQDKLVDIALNRIVTDIPKDRTEGMIQDGLSYTQEVSVPTKGGPYFLRIGVQDQTTNKVGALEISVSKVANLPPITPKP